MVKGKIETICFTDPQTFSQDLKSDSTRITEDDLGISDEINALTSTSVYDPHDYIKKVKII